jgi:general secretion pathway protein A
MENLPYLSQLALERHPFPVAPDDESFFVSLHIEQVMAEIIHGISARKGFMVLSGDVGLGKTTISRRILRILSQKKVCTSLVFHTSLKDVDLLREINRDFGLTNGQVNEQTNQIGEELKRLNDFLMARYREGRNCAIIIDDAQNLDRSSLELVRMISNLETDQQKLVQILLVGQTELMDILDTEEMRQLQSRVIIAKNVRPLDRDELRDYIMFKLNQAGNQGHISVAQDGFRRLFQFTRGNFRQVNILMDRCLYVICNEENHRIDGRTVKTAMADLNPQKVNSRTRFIAMAAGIVLPMAVALAAWSFHLYSSRQVSADSSQTVSYYKVSDTLKENNSRTSKGQESSMQPSATGAPVKNPTDDSAVAVFLRVQHLDSYLEDFQRAMIDGAFSPVAEKIYRETGYQLVQLSIMPAQIRQRYGALAVPQIAEQEPKWLLFWKPKLQLRRFYYHYQGEEINQLQKLLHHHNLYGYTMDGIVGTRLMKAVIAFQKKQGLPVTGFPDAATVFLLCHQQEDS